MIEKPQTGEPGRMALLIAILAGQLFVNIPVVVIMLGAIWLGRLMLNSYWWIFLLVGFAVAWLWWAFALPRWRQWALQKGIPEDRLHKAAVMTGLEWPKW